jgi:uncharacterized membrane protein YdjX (TVP38/TMEM64 family)
MHASLSTSGSRALIVLALVALLALAVVTLPVRDWLQAALIWTAGHPASAALSFIALYIVASVCLVPGLILTLAAGALFGLAWGTVMASLGSVLGATAAFLLGRTLARNWIRQRIESWPKIRALDRAIGARGFWTVLLTRLSPAFPFNLLNYAYGVTSVRPRDFILASWIGMLPATVVYVYAGSAATSLAEALTGNVGTGGARHWLLWVGLLATLLVTVLVTRLARRQLERELAT